MLYHDSYKLRNLLSPEISAVKRARVQSGAVQEQNITECGDA